MMGKTAEMTVREGKVVGAWLAGGSVSQKARMIFIKCFFRVMTISYGLEDRHGCSFPNELPWSEEGSESLVHTSSCISAILAPVLHTGGVASQGLRRQPLQSLEPSSCHHVSDRSTACEKYRTADQGSGVAGALDFLNLPATMGMPKLRCQRMEDISTGKLHSF